VPLATDGGQRDQTGEARAPAGRAVGMPASPQHGPVPEDLYSSWCPSPSPDGRVAFVSDRSGLPEVWSAALSGGPAEPVALGGRRVTAVSWSPTGEWLACVVAPPGRSRSEVWVVRPDGTGARLVAGAEPGTAVLPEGRSGGWTRDGALVVTEAVSTCAVLRVQPANGERDVLVGGELTVAVDVSEDGRRLLLRRGPRGARELVLLDLGSGALRPVLPDHAPGSMETGCLSPDGAVVYARTDVGRELYALFVVAEDGGVRVLDHPDGELEDVALSADGSRASLLWNVRGGLSELSLLDVATGVEQPYGPLPRPVVSHVGLSGDGRRLVLTAEGPADPRGIWTSDAETGALVPLSSLGQGELHASVGASATGIDPHDVVAPELRRFSSADGTELTGWLYRPGPGPAPTMIWLHGGPEAQERPVYNSLFQSLVARGVAVLAPNVRGSTGFGRTFRHADDLAGRHGAFEDVEACAEHLVATGVAEPGRLALAGRSYGGYLTLAGLVRFPELFRVGVDVCGMSDLETFYADTEPWIAAAAVSKYGDPERDRALLRELSPLHAIDRLRAPLLIVHGSDDTNVPLGEAQQVADALTERGLPHRLLVFEGEGHELLATRNRVAFVQTVVGWLAEHL